MLTGDAAINAGAPIICCTAEVLAQMSLGNDDAMLPRYVVMDEFHYYADRDRGMAWQIPLLTLSRARFLLMSATLGDTSDIRRRLETFTGAPVALVRSTDRPVPLEFSYSEIPITEAITDLLTANRAPVYVVNFTQRDCHELAGGLMSIDICTKPEKRAIADALKGVRFDTPYGKEISRFLRHGVGVHHAGLLPRYRLLVESLAQSGHLKIVSGTDTLGVGINVPIRTVLFSKLCKYDGVKTRVLAVRDFKQIAGRAGRKGYDDHGWVVCQAPAHVVENKRLERRAGGDTKKLRRLVRKKPPERGYAHWDHVTFEKLASSEPEALKSRFDVSHGMVLNLLQRSPDGYRQLIDLIARSHERSGRQTRLRRKSAHLFRTLRAAKVLEVANRRVSVREDLQDDFSIHHTLSLYLLAAVGRLPPDTDDFALQVLTRVESILEDPHVVLMRQRDRLIRDRIAELKADGVPFDDRQEIIDEITWPMPDAETVCAELETFAEDHPWVRIDDLRSKSVARDMYERFASFNEYVRTYSLEKSEGVLLRYLSQVYKTLLQNVPEAVRDDSVVDLVAWMRATLARADSSLVQTWEAMVHGEPQTEPGEGGGDPEQEHPAPQPVDISRHPKLFAARIRTELHAFVKALRWKRWQDAVEALRPHPENPVDAATLKAKLAPFHEAYSHVMFDHEARNSKRTLVELVEPRRWRVRQVLHDEQGDDMWYVEAEVDLRAPADDGPVVTLVDVLE